MKKENQPASGAEIPYERATRSGLEKFTEDLEVSPEATQETGVEDFARLKLLSRQAWRLSSELKRYIHDKSLTAEEKGLVESASRLAFEYGDELASALEFTEDLRLGGLSETDAEFRRKAIENIGERLRNWQVKFAALPVESRFSDRRVKAALKKLTAVAAIAAVLGLGAYQWQSAHEAQSQKSAEGGKEKKEKNVPQVRDENKEGTPDMDDLGKEPGKAEKPKPFARVTFSYFSAIRDPLWATEVYRRAGGGGRMELVEERVVKEGWRTHAQVVTEPLTVPKGEDIILPVPVGYGIKVESVSAGAPAYVARPSNHTIRFEENADDVVIRYNVVKVQKSFPMDDPRPQKLNRTQDQEKIIGNLERAPLDKQKEVLSEHLKNFTYVVSSQLDRLLRIIPGNLEEKIGAIKVGDCDMFSLYAAGLMNDAGGRALVAAGLPEKNGILDKNRPHAKLVLFDGADNPETFETTALPSKSFINLKFSAEDLRQLKALAYGMQGLTGEELLRRYEDFRIALENILARPEYAEYSAEEGLVSTEREKEQRKFVEDIAERLSNIPAEAGEIGAFSAASLLLMLGMIVGIAGAVAATNRISRTLGRKIKNQQTQKALEMLKDFFQQESGPPLAGDLEHAKRLSRSIEEAYAKRPVWERFYPIREVMQLSAGQKIDFLRFMRMTEQFIENDSVETIGFIISLLADYRWSKAVAQVESEGWNLEKTLEHLNDVLVSPGLKKRFEKNIPAMADFVMREARRTLIAKIEPLEKIGKANLENVFKILGAEKVFGLHSKRASRKPRSEAGTDFIDYVPYEPGMDLKTLDWNLYARTEKLYVKRTAESVADKRKTSINLLIDVTASQWELAGLASLLMYGQKSRVSFNVNSITFTAEGEVVEHIPPPAAGKLLQEGPDSIQKLIVRILDLTVKHGVLQFKPFLYKNWDDLISSAPLRNLGKGEKFLVVGAPPMGDEFIHQSQLIRFEYERLPEVKQAGEEKNEAA